ncbi:Guanylate-binding protein 5 [Manis javanica]|nr:Guanylate-binding protein 5 [Manis javanica]
MECTVQAQYCRLQALAPDLEAELSAPKVLMGEERTLWYEVADERRRHRHSCRGNNFCDGVHLTEKERNWAVPYPVHRPKIVLKVMVDVHYILETEQLYRKTGLLFFALSVALKNSFEFNTIDYLSLLLLHFKTYMDDEFHVAVERLGQGLQGEVVHWGQHSGLLQSLVVSSEYTKHLLNIDKCQQVINKGTGVGNSIQKGCRIQLPKP